MFAVGVVVLLGAAAFAATSWNELTVQTTDRSIDWWMLGIIGGLLLVCERLPIAWIRVGPRATVTPLWLFALALLLVGSPTIGISVAVAGALIHAIHRRLGTVGIFERVAGTSLSLAAGAYALRSFGVTEAVTGYGRVPWTWALGIITAAGVIVVTNAIVSTLIATVQQRRGITSVFRRTLATQVTAEGALLSLAPLWVIGLDFSPVLIPLLGATTVLVFRSTREALERSHEAQHDALTGLPNRRSFLDELEDAIGGSEAPMGKPLSVMLMDLDGFKDVNDQLGHAVGDALLISFGERLTRSVGNAGVVARLGGDEFAVMVNRRGDSEGARALADDLQARLSAPLVVDGFPISAGVSIGIASFPDDGATAAELLRAADIAMYRTKRARRSGDRRLGTQSVARRSQLSLLGEIGVALDRGDLHVHFQPQIALSTGDTDTVEALVRWQHPQHGMIPPKEFIGLAEQTDLIAPITRTVLQRATRELLMTGEGDVKLAVNVTARSLIDPRFAHSVFEVLSETRFPAERLELEITERALVSHPERSADTIEQLRAAGVRIALDDFGAGYASYQTLRILDVDRVKIDSAFVTGIVERRRDRTIVASLISLAHELGFDVVAEGVESEQVYDQLVELECDVAQGFYIAVPMGFNELDGWLSSWRQRTTRAPLRLVR